CNSSGCMIEVVGVMQGCCVNAPMIIVAD
ncbi:hypothetical protein A2U01_0056625, partial [Trifolium medium]|nr:hypothetical protein [Trifolium medium]